MSDSTHQPLTGRTVLVTGTVEGFTRDEARQAIIDLGGTPAAGVTKKVDLVILGEGAGVSKTAKARQLKVLVLDASSFADLSNTPERWDGEPLGMTFADYDTAHGPEPEPEDPQVASGHRVGKVVVWTPVDEGYQRQVRLRCTCGHGWLRHELWGPESCPVQPATT
jgi:hypothetical protein